MAVIEQMEYMGTVAKPFTNNLVIYNASSEIRRMIFLSVRAEMLPKA